MFWNENDLRTIVESFTYMHKSNIQYITLTHLETKVVSNVFQD